MTTDVQSLPRGGHEFFSRSVIRMWPLTIVVGFLIAYFILKFVVPAKTTPYISYYKSEPKAKGSPLAEEDALVGAGLATRMKPSVMDSTSLSPAEMVIMSPAPAPMMPMAPAPMAPAPMMPMSPAPSPMMAKGNAPVTMTMVPAPAPVA